MPPRLPIRVTLFTMQVLCACMPVRAIAETVLPEVAVTARGPGHDIGAQGPESRITVSGETQAAAGLTSMSELASRMPGLGTFGATPRVSALAVRGVGNNQYNDGLDSSVGLYVDGMYLARQAYSAFGLHDLERVTLLRGAQGAAYGPGSTAGEVHLQTRQPSRVAGAELGLGVGDLGLQRVTAMVTGPLVEDTLAGRLSFYSQVRDGLVRNRFDDSLLNDQDRLGLRGQLLWAPSGALTMRLAVEHEVIDQSCCALQLLAPLRTNVAASDAYMGYDRIGTDPYDRETDNDVASRGRMQHRAVSLTTEWAPTPQHRLVSLSSARDLAYEPARNDDSTSLHLLTGYVTSRSSQLTQEFRWHADYTRVRSTLGLFYMHQDLSGEELGVLGDEIALWAFGGLLREQAPLLNRGNSGWVINTFIPPRTLDGMRISTPYAQVSDTLSGFASADWLLTDATTLSSGLRWTGSYREADISRSRSGGDIGASPLAVTDSLVPVGNLLGVDLRGATFSGLIDSLLGKPFQRHDERTDQGLSGRVALQHRLTPQWATHVALSQGYKSGGINLAGLSGQVPPQFEPEITRGAEIGVRGSWLDDRLGMSLVLYHTDVRDYQAVTYDEGGALVSSPRQNNVINIPGVRLQGVELDVGAAFRQGLDLSLGVAYNRAISRDFANAPNEDTDASDKDLNGRPLYNAPRWSGHVGLSQRIELPGARELFVALDHSFRSGTFGAVEQSRNSYIDAYQLTDFRMGLRDRLRGWGVQAWVKNIFDAQYLAAVAGVYGLGDYGGYAGDPRTYGVTLDMAWGR